MLDLKNNWVWGNTLPPLLRAASGNGTGIDFKTADGPCFAIVSTGVITDGTHDIKMQESVDDSTYTDIPGATFAQIVAADDNVAPRLISFQRTKRYVRAATTLAGTTTGGLFQVCVASRKKIS